MSARFQFTPTELAHLREVRALSRDAQGNSVLVGLSLEETIFYVTYARSRLAGKADHDDGEQYLALHQRHERARLSVIAAEVELRNENALRH